MNAILLNVIEQFNYVYKKYTSCFTTYKITQYNSLNVKQSNLQLHKLKSEVKNKSEVV